MRKRIGLLVVEAASTATLVVGVAMLLSPIVLYLWLGADNDVYVTLQEATSMMPVVLLQFGLEPMFRPSFLLWPALFIIIGVALRWLMLRWRATPAAQIARQV